MSGNSTVIIDRLTLRLPRGTERNAKAISREIARALAERGVMEHRARLAVVADPPKSGDAPGPSARRIAAAVVGAAKRGGGHAG